MYVSSQSVSQLSSIYSYLCSWVNLDFHWFIVFAYEQGKDEAAEKQRIKEEKEKGDDAAERDHQLRLAANEEAKVSNVVDNWCKLTHYLLYLPEEAKSPKTCFQLITYRMIC